MDAFTFILRESTNVRIFHAEFNRRTMSHVLFSIYTHKHFRSEFVLLFYLISLLKMRVPQGFKWLHQVYAWRSYLWYPLRFSWCLITSELLRQLCFQEQIRTFYPQNNQYCRRCMWLHGVVTAVSTSSVKIDWSFWSVNIICISN